MSQHGYQFFKKPGKIALQSCKINSIFQRSFQYWEDLKENLKNFGHFKTFDEHQCHRVENWILKNSGWPPRHKNCNLSCSAYYLILRGLPRNFGLFIFWISACKIQLYLNASEIYCFLFVFYTFFIRKIFMRNEP